MQPIALQKYKLFFRSGSTIGIVSLWKNSNHRKITEILLGRVGVVSFTVTRNHCTLVLTNQQAGSYVPATESDIIRFWTLPFGYLMWHLSTNVNNCLIAAYITVFEQRRCNHRSAILFMVYVLFYTSIASNLVILDIQIPWSDSLYTYTWPPFSMKTLLRWHRTVETRLLINWQLALNRFGSYQLHYIWN